MRKTFVIFNPAARGEKSQRLRAFLQAQAGPRVTLAPTACAGDATQLAARGVAEGFDLIVAAGGDGTINEVINGIGTTGVALGVLPLGTVNVFAREMAIPLRLEPAWALLQSGTVRTLDLPFVEFGHQRRRYFAQLAGVGFDALAVRGASWALKKKIGPLCYVVAGFQALGATHPVLEVLSQEGRRCQGVAVLVGNGRYYGGSFRLFPEARYDDGLLDVCVFPSTRYADLLRYGFGILRAAHHRLADVHYLQTAGFTCQAPAGQPTAFELDGEDAGDSPVRFGVVGAGLRLVCAQA